MQFDGVAAAELAHGGRVEHGVALALQGGVNLRRGGDGGEEQGAGHRQDFACLCTAPVSRMRRAQQPATLRVMSGAVLAAVAAV